MSRPPEQLAEFALRQLQEGDAAGGSATLVKAMRGYQARGALADAARVGIAGARLAVMAGEHARAGELLDEVAPIAAGAGQHAELLDVRAEHAQRVGDAAAQEAAWRACAAEGPPARALKAWSELFTLARAEGNLALLREAIDQALALALATGDRAAEAEIRIENAIALTQDDLAAARAELDRAEALLDPADLPSRARIVGQRGLCAFLDERPDDALALVREARALAVQSSAVAPYLAATTLLTVIHERRGDLVAALDEMLRAEASLADLLGPAGGELVRPALALFEERLGPAAYAEVYAGWQAMRRAAKARGEG